MIPFNVELLDLRKLDHPSIRPVRSMDHFDGASTNFHEDGLFSIAIFGRTGDEARDKRFSYIDIKTTIFHPVIYQSLVRLKGLYKDIMAGRRYALWDNEKKDFIACSDLEGETGYHFFVKHWKKIEFKNSNSATRNVRIQLIEKYKNRAMGSKVVVIPAGLRDLQIDDLGRTTEDEINGLYRQLLGISNAISVTTVDDSGEIFNTPRHSLQMKFNEIYELIERMLTGKKGFIQNKWGSRRIINGTRNVISTMDLSTDVFGQPNAPKYTDTVIGLYQTIKGALPIAKHALLNGWVSQAFSQGNGQAYLIDKKTLKPEMVTVPWDVHDRWTTAEGIEKVISSYSQVAMRHRPVEIEGRYLGLIYIGPDMTFRIFGDIDDLPEHLDRKYVEPLTYCQLIYLSGYRRWNTLGCYVTRYPITGVGSIYPSKVYVKTSVVGEMRYELDHNWEKMGDEYVALEFPKKNPDAHVDTIIPHPSRLEGLGAD